MSVGLKICWNLEHSLWAEALGPTDRDRVQRKTDVLFCVRRDSITTRATPIQGNHFSSEICVCVCTNVSRLHVLPDNDDCVAVCDCECVCVCVYMFFRDTGHTKPNCITCADTASYSKLLTHRFGTPAVRDDRLTVTAVGGALYSTTDRGRR